MIQLTGRIVHITDGNVERGLKKFKKKIQTSGLLNEVKDRTEYTKPTTARKLARNAAKNRWKRYLVSQELPTKKY